MRSAVGRNGSSTILKFSSCKAVKVVGLRLPFSMIKAWSKKSVSVLSHVLNHQSLQAYRGSEYQCLKFCHRFQRLPAIGVHEDYDICLDNQKESERSQKSARF